LERKRLRQQRAGEVEHGGSGGGNGGGGNGGSGGDFTAPPLTAAVESDSLYSSGESTSNDRQLSTIEEYSEPDKQSSISDKSSLERIEEGVVRVAHAHFEPPISFTFDKKAPSGRSVRPTELELRPVLELRA
jgi:hypothetical protein